MLKSRRLMSILPALVSTSSLVEQAFAFVAPPSPPCRGTLSSPLFFLRNHNNHHNYNDVRRQTTRHDMFTGIIEEMGSVVSLEKRDDMELWDGSIGSGTELTIQAQLALQDAYVGCSISVNGVCLTATELMADRFKVGLAPETLSRSSLGSLKTGDVVNLERASEIGARNSGHFVQGHVDGTGEIMEMIPDEDSLRFRVRVPNHDIISGIVPKGFVAVDGTSLTVIDVDPEESWFTFMLVGHTQKKVILSSKPIGGLVNIEMDVLGKYSASAISAILPRLEATEANMVSLEAKMVSLGVRVDSLEAKADSLEAKVESLEAKVESLKRELGRRRRP